MNSFFFKKKKISSSVQREAIAKGSVVGNSKMQDFDQPNEKKDYSSKKKRENKSENNGNVWCENN